MLLKFKAIFDYYLMKFGSPSAYWYIFFIRLTVILQMLTLFLNYYLRDTIVLGFSVITYNNKIDN